MAKNKYKNPTIFSKIQKQKSLQGILMFQFAPNGNYTQLKET